MKPFLSILCAAFLVSVVANAEIRVAVTVDDLPVHGPLPPGVTRSGIASRMISIFKRFAVPEVYGFVNARNLHEENATDNARVLRLWIDAGYPLGNHTFSHPDLNKVSVRDFEADIDRDEPVLEKLSGGRGDWKVFRYPFLHKGDSLPKRESVRAYLLGKKYKIAEVTIDFEDWSWNSPYARCLAKGDEKAIRKLRSTYINNAVDALIRSDRISKALFGRSVPHVLLLHVGAFDVEMLSELLGSYKDKGVVFIPLTEALKDGIYSLDPRSTQNSLLIFQIMDARRLTLNDLGIENYYSYPKSLLASICR